MEDRIANIIKQRSVEIQMQVVLSPNTDIAAGVEALARGKSLHNDSYISPYELMSQARDAGLGIELEELLIDKSIETFSNISKEEPELLLFVNISHDYLARATETDYVYKCADKHSVSCDRIVFDLLPFDESYYEIAQAFIDHHKEKGFYICMDDIGVNYSNLDKILYLNPDIIKVNRYKFQDLKNSDYKKHMPLFLKSITNHLGIMIVEKGIESEHEFEASIKSGAQFVQGFYVSEPVVLHKDSLNRIIDAFREKVQKLSLNESNEKETTREITSRMINIMKEVISTITEVNESLMISHMNMIFDAYPFIENIWLLDLHGSQIFDSFINYKDFNVKNSPIFQIYKDGSDFSEKELYRQLMDTILDVWVTKPYKSILTNNVCVGGSTYVENLGKDYILCMNVNYDLFLEYMKK